MNKRNGDPAGLSPPVTATVRVERVIYRAEDGWSVLAVRPLEGVPDGAPGSWRAVGQALASAQPGDRLELAGRWREHARYGQQLEVWLARPADPSPAPPTAEGIRRYLASRRFHGIGPRTAEALVEAWGRETLQVLAEAPEKVQQLASIPPHRRAQVEEALRRGLAGDRGASDLLAELHGLGLSDFEVRALLQAYGADAMRVLREQPFRLTELRGFGFRRVDAIAARLGVPAGDAGRLQAGVLYALERLAEQGHTAVPQAALVEHACRLLARDGQQPSAKAVEEAIAAHLGAGGSLLRRDEHIALRPLADAEQDIARAVSCLRGAPGGAESEGAGQRPAGAPPCPATTASGLTLHPDQLAAVQAACEEPLLIVTGGPGTGKSTVVNEILAAWRSALALDLVDLCAPTAQAAQRLAQVTGLAARTVHRTLGVTASATGGFAWVHGPGNPLRSQAVVVDEASMLDVSISAALFAALPAGARLVLVGDANQLPSVGPGRVLADLIDSGLVPVRHLSQNFRQAEGSAIVQAAQRIREGRLPPLQSHGDWHIERVASPQEAEEWLVQTCLERVKAHGGDIAAVQVLSCMYRGPAGVMALNRRLQRLLNPRAGEEEPFLAHGGGRRRGERGWAGEDGEPGDPAEVWYPGDKILCTRNLYDRELVNGDLGRVAEIRPGRDGSVAILEFPHTVVEVPAGAEARAFQLAYAMSVHKSQGSEFPEVLLPVLKGHYIMLDRSLLYTAVTRARRRVHLAAEPAALAIAVSREEANRRSTQLVAYLRDLNRFPPAR